jgi:hypothetical protein
MEGTLMPKEFIMRGQTTTGAPTEVLNITGYRPGYGYRLTEFAIYPSTSIGSQACEMSASITADNSSEAPDSPNFNHDGLIATALLFSQGTNGSNYLNVVINDLFVITQDLILQVADTQNTPINWQVKFKEVKLSKSAEAVANFKQYTIYNTSS